MTDTIGQRMTHIRASESQRQFAEALGVPLRTYQNYEQDKREPDLRTLAGLHSLGWNLNWVLTGEGSERLEALSTNVVRDNSAGYPASSQPVRTADITLAVQLAEEALEGKRLGPEDYGQLVGLIHDALVNGLPNAQVLAFARPAARGIRGSSSEELGKSGKAAAG